MDRLAVIALLDGMIEQQKNVLLKTGRRIVPMLTPEDILQPNDYLELENHPHFRYEEGILAGLQSTKSALLYSFQEHLRK